MNVQEIKTKYLGDESLSQMTSLKLEKYGTKEAKAKAQSRFENKRFKTGNSATVMKAASGLSDALDELSRKLPSNTGNRNIDGFVQQLKAMIAKGQKVANVAFEAARN